MSNHMERARMARAGVIDLLARFPAMTRNHVSDILFGGNARTANRVLLSLVRAGRVYRYPLVLRGEYIYSLRKRPTGHLEHHLAIAGLYAALVRSAPQSRSVTAAANVELTKGLITDLLVVAGDLAILTEVHLGSNPFGSKLDRYADYRQSGEWERAPWWRPGMQVIVWLVAPAAGVGHLERLAMPHRVGGMRVVVTGLAMALVEPWGLLQVEVAGQHSGSGKKNAIQWRWPKATMMKGIT